MTSRDGRYRQDRDYWRDVAMDAIAYLHEHVGKDFGLLDDRPEWRDKAQSWAKESHGPEDDDG